MAKGKKTGGGSRKGRPNKSTLARKALIAASGLSPLEYMLERLRNTSLPAAERLDAAKAAAPYVHPRLNSVDMHGSVDVVEEVRRTLVDPKAQ